MFNHSIPTRRFSPAMALTVAAILGGSFAAAGTAQAQTQGAVATPPPTRVIAASPATPTPAPRPSISPVGPGTLVASDEGETPDPPAPLPQGNLLSEAPISLGAMVKRIQSGITVNGGPVGWAYAVTKNGNLVAANQGGYARLPGDQGGPANGVAFGINTRIELMSVTKPITAMATLRALNAANVSVDTPIAPFLPSGWAKGPGFSWTSTKPITFRHLLTHTSGILQATQDPKNDITGWGNAWDSLQPLVKAGATPDVGAGEKYKNANYALLRVILPDLWAMADGPKSPITKANHGLRYLDYVNTKLLAPSGIAPTACWDTNDSIAPLVYNKADLGIGGAHVEYDDNPQECGGHVGLHLSALDLVKLTDTLRRTTKIMPAVARDAMFAEDLGWKMASNDTGTESANVWWHGGDGFFGGGREVHTCVMNAPQGYQLSMIMNSARPGKESQCRILLDAVNDGRTAK